MCRQAKKVKPELELLSFTWKDWTPSTPVSAFSAAATHRPQVMFSENSTVDTFKDIATLDFVQLYMF